MEREVRTLAEQIFVCLLCSEGRKEQVGGTFEKMKHVGGEPPRWAEDRAGLLSPWMVTCGV